MNARRPLIAGNWKMHETIAQARALVRALRALTLPSGVDVAVAPPFTALAAVAGELSGSSIALCAQTMHERDEGPYTGEISAPMLRELGVTYVILGHSERRAGCAENDAAINRKVQAALTHGITPIVAVGETRDEHSAGQALPKVTHQTRAAFAGVAAAAVERCVVAYEPVWAIGSGLSDEPASADRVMAEIRACTTGLGDARILYGGSMKADNAALLLAQPNIDGGLIGGASLSAASFGAIAECARTRALT
ncbi:MAG: triose-phosphate isomerase [Candidatus Eremiobacteraeota bacterium]|nr:triose-phosphate isomerase [Candidatus Eremiobacteraeota bacterium]MBC5802621.1 triose-phosphate isomerase [Candidatus Eremiobacteraeota bacterium]MBC5822933.1 triose-phosphate isomerase [Candidatus Eremiobacteraeota bacterium]